jgi:hypothetical protein
VGVSVDRPYSFEPAPSRRGEIMAAVQWIVGMALLYGALIAFFRFGFS